MLEAREEITLVAANKAACRNPFKNRLEFKMGQIEDKAAAPWRSNELGTPRTISKGSRAAGAIIPRQFPDYYFYIFL